MPETCGRDLNTSDLSPQVAEGRRNIYPIMGKLLNAVIPPALERIREGVEANPESSRAHAYSIPYDRISNNAARLLPTMGTDDEPPLLPTPDLSPETRCSALNTLNDRWLVPHTRHAVRRGRHPGTTTESQRVIMRGLYHWTAGGGTVDPESWKMNQAVYARQLDRGHEILCQAAFDMCDDYGSYFNERFRGFSYLTGRYEESLIAATAVANDVGALVRAPIGYYGEQNALDSLRAAILMMHYLWQDDQLLSDIKERLDNPGHPGYDPRYRGVFQHHTVRANGMRYGPLEYSIRDGVVEGAFSVHAVKHLRTAEADPKYPSQSDYRDLIAAMTKQGSANATTVRASLSLAGLSERQGLYLPGFTGTTPSQEALHTLVRVRQHATDELNKEWAAFGEKYVRLQREHGFRDYHDYLRWLTGRVALEAYSMPDPKLSSGAVLLTSRAATPRPPIRTGQLFCPVADPAQCGDDVITMMEQTALVLLDCVRERPCRPVAQVALPWEALTRYPIGAAARDQGALSA